MLSIWATHTASDESQICTFSQPLTYRSPKLIYVNSSCFHHLCQQRVFNSGSFSVLTKTGSKEHLQNNLFWVEWN